MNVPEDGTPRCLGCGYSLAGLPAGKCPECGRGFDPAVRESFGPPLQLIRLRESALWWCRGNGWILNAMTAVACVALLADSSVGGESFVAVSLIKVLGGTLVIRASVAMLRALRVGLPAHEGFARWRRWLITPVALLVVGVLGDYNVPLRLRLACSAGALESVARQSLAGAAPGTVQSTRVRKYIGGMPVTAVCVRPPEVWFGLDAGRLDRWRVAVVYAPGGAPSSPKQRRTERLEGNWYLVEHRYYFGPHAEPPPVPAVGPASGNGWQR